MSCGEELPRDEASREESRMHHVLTTLMTTFVFLGATSAVWLGIDIYLLSPVDEPITFDSASSSSSSSTATTCASNPSSEWVQAQRSRGYQEIEGREGMRCFQR
jgi:hypothetical protein